MSSVEEVSGLGNNQAHFKYDFSKIFLRNNLSKKVNIAASGEDLTLEPGDLIGVVGSTYQVFKSGTANITVAGVLMEYATITDGNNADLNICIAGEIAEEKVNLDGSDTLATVVSNRTIEDKIQGETVGIKLVSTDTLVTTDNE